MILFGVACFAAGAATILLALLIAYGAVATGSLNMNPLSLLSDSAKAWIIGLLVLFATVQTARLEHAKADLKSARGDLKTARAALINPATKKTWQSEAADLAGRLSDCRTSNAGLRSGIDAQNAQVAAWAAEAANARAEAEKALSAARRATATANQRVGQVLATKPGPDLCKSADDLIIGSLQK